MRSPSSGARNSTTSGTKARTTAVLLSVILAFIVAARAWAVWEGTLFGTAQVALVDVIIAALVALSFWCWARRAGRDTEAAPAGGTWLDRVSGFAAVVALPALVAATLNLFAPSTPPSLSVAACSGAQTWSMPYHGRTIGTLGNYARSGPGVSFPQSGRFKADCTLGFLGFCVGDPVDDPFAENWVDTRWLLLGSHRSGPAKWTARLSGEPAEPRFVALAYIAPNSPDARLTYLGDEVCAQGRPLPSRPTLTPVAKPDGTIDLSIAVDNAERVGVALVVPDDALRAGGSVRWVWSGTPDAASATRDRTKNPGPLWKANLTARDLKPKQPTPVPVTLVATACLGPLHASAPDRAATLSYRIGPDGRPRLDNTVPPLQPDLLDRVRRMACEVDYAEPQG
jgi:hypothetical protein